MSEQLHPGHALLRKLLPEANDRHRVVVVLTNTMVSYHALSEQLNAVHVSEVLNLWNVSCTHADATYIAEFIHNI